MEDELYISTEDFDQVVSLEFDASVGFLMGLHNLLNLGLDIGAFEEQDVDSLTNMHEAIVEKLTQFASTQIDET